MPITIEHQIHPNSSMVRYRLPREIQVQARRIDQQPPMPVLVDFARDQERGKYTRPGDHRIRERPRRGGVAPQEKQLVASDKATMTQRASALRATGQRLTASAPPPVPCPPLPESIHRHGGIKHIQHRLHVQARAEQHPDVETGAHERRQPAARSTGGSRAAHRRPRARPPRVSIQLVACHAPASCTDSASITARWPSPAAPS